MGGAGEVRLGPTSPTSLIGERYFDSGGPPDLVCELRDGDVIIAVSTDPRSRPANLRSETGDPLNPPPFPSYPPRRSPYGTASRRIRVWVPRSNTLCWIWQTDARGVPAVAWLGPESTRARSPTPPRRGCGIPTAFPVEARVCTVDDCGPLYTVIESGFSGSGLWPGKSQQSQQPKMGEATAASLRQGDIVLVHHTATGHRGPSPLGKPSPAQATAVATTAAHPRKPYILGTISPRVRGHLTERLWVPEGALSDLTLPTTALTTAWPNHLPPALLARANWAFDQLVADGSAANAMTTPTTAVRGGLRSSAEPSVFSDAVWLRHPYWRDLIDPELCLHPLDSGGWRWQPAEVAVDWSGRVHWESWVNHLDPVAHRELLTALAALLEHALPAAERAAGHRLRDRRLQVVVRAYEQTVEAPVEGTPSYTATTAAAAVNDDSAASAATADPTLTPTLTRISDWHTDGSPSDDILVTVVCYLDVSPTVGGGELEFQVATDLFTDDPDTLGGRVTPCSGEVVGFHNAALRHMVHPIHGVGRRRTVTFHVVHPEGSGCIPLCTALPRQLRVQRRAETLAALQDALGDTLPRELIEYIWDGFLGEQGAALATLTARRDTERHRRLFRGRHPRTATGFSDFGESTGTSTTGFTDEDDFDGNYLVLASAESRDHEAALAEVRAALADGGDPQ